MKYLKTYGSKTELTLRLQNQSGSQEARDFAGVPLRTFFFILGFLASRLIQ